MSYGLIFGKAGLPVLGVQGAAIGTTFARVLELSLLLFLIYKYRTPAAAKLSEMFSFGTAFFKRVLRTAMPAMANEIIWSLGITVYNAVYAHIGTDAIAAVNINGTFENIAFVTFLGIGHSCAIMVGNEIGAGNRQRAQEIGGVFLLYGLAGAVLMGSLYKLVTPQLLHLYNISDISANLARQIIAIYSFSLWVRATNFMLFIGILRAGGDTHFALKVESFTIWLVGVPAALIGGFVFHLPVYGVYAMVLAEEVVKALVVLPRYRSRAWIHDLVNVAA
jgi:Na+-driven multidrug efflux pump